MAKSIKNNVEKPNTQQEATLKESFVLPVSGKVVTCRPFEKITAARAGKYFELVAEQKMFLALQELVLGNCFLDGKEIFPNDFENLHFKDAQKLIFDSVEFFQLGNDTLEK